MKQNKRLDVRFLLPAFLLPAALYSAVMAVLGISPFGEQTLLIWDANGQYAAFFAYWQHVLAGGQTALYSLSRAMGGNMAGLIAYYLGSPLNALFALFSGQNLPLAYSVVALIKLGLCGATFMAYLRRIHGAGYEGLLFSLSYALCGYVAVFVWNLMWLDALILLPLVAMGIHRICERRRPLLFSIALGLTLISHFYIGFMVCVFSALYLAYTLLVKPVEKPWRCVALFAGASLLAAGLAAVMLLPAWLSIQKGYAMFAPQLFEPKWIQSPADVLAHAFTGAVSYEQLRYGAANWYIGIPLLMTACFYFLNRRISLRERLLSLGFAAFFLLSFLFGPLYYAWHAFDFPTYFPARFSFLFSFLLLVFAYKGYRGLRELERKRRLTMTFWTAGGLLLLAAVLWIWRKPDYLTAKSILTDAAIALAVGAAVVFGGGQKWSKLCVLAICAAQVFCLAANAYYAQRRLLTAVPPLTATEYSAEQEQEADILGRIRAQDDGLYRIERNDHRTSNEPLAFDYMGLTHFSSDIDAAHLAFVKNIGLYQVYYSVLYASGNTPVLESLLGVKYLIRDESLALEALPDTYELLWTQDGRSVYRNTCALPLALLAPAQSVSLDDDNPFVNQNLLMRDLTGSDAQVFEPVWDIGRVWEEPWETYTFAVQAGKRLYMSSAGRFYRFNGGQTEGHERFNGIVSLPVAAEDTEYALQMMSPLGIHLAYFNPEAFQEAVERLRPYAVTVTRHTDAYLSMHVDVPADRTRLLLTLPYDEGWKAKIDGEPAEITSRYGALLELEVPQGGHEVELRFMPAGLQTGLFVSAASLLCALAVCLWQKPRKGKETFVKESDAD